MPDNRKLLEKADIAISDLVSDGGYLQPKVAQQFIRSIIEEARLMKLCDVRGMGSHTERFPKIKFGSRVMRPGVDGVALSAAERVKPDLAQVEITTKEIKGTVHIPYGVLEDNVEGAALQQTILSLLQDAVARDVDELVLNGDTTSADSYLALMDGFRKQATTHTVAAAGATLQTDLLDTIVRTLPHKYLRMLSGYSFLTSHNAVSDYVKQMSSRGTALGDTMLQGNIEPKFHGSPLIPLDMMPETLGVGNRTDCLFTNPKNMMIGVWRQIRIETDRDIEAGVVMIVTTMRLGCKYQEEDAVVHASNILAS